MALIVIFGIIIIIAVFTYLGTAALDGNIQSSLQERVILAQTSARNIDDLLKNLDNLLTTTAAEEDWSVPGNLGLAMDRAYRHLDQYVFQIYFLDTNGKVVEARPALLSTVSFNNFASVNAVLKGQRFGVSRFIRPIGSTFSSTLASVPVHDRSGNMIGALVASIDLTAPNVHIFTEPIGLGETGYMDLVDLGGTILASTRPERIGLESDHGESLRSMIREHRQVVSTCHDCHTSGPETQLRREVLAFAPLEQAQWGIAIHQSEEEAFSAIHVLRNRILVLAIVILTGGLVLVSITTHSIIRPVKALIVATQRISNGDLDTPLKIGGHDEISRLASSFDVMRSKLKVSISEIKAWNHELDNRVREKTTACRHALDENISLLAELQRKERARNVLLRQVISAQEEERKRISRELHDETCQTVAALAFKLDEADEMAVTSEMHKLLEQMHGMTETTQVELHRIIMDLRPTMLDHLGLIPALRWYIETRFKGLGIHHYIRVLGDVYRLPPEVEITLFRVVQEAVNNIARHSKARQADFVFEYFDDRVEVRVTDNGVGFDVEGGMGCQDGNRGLGLMGMAERMNTIEGEFYIRSMPAQGTTIELVVMREETRDVKDPNSGGR